MRALRGCRGWMLALVCACGPKTGGADADESDDGGTSGGDATSGEASTTTGGETGEPPTIADCSMLGPSGQPIDPPLTATGFPASCSPREDLVLPEGYKCCSDDPQAIGGNLPSYQGREDLGDVPIFADANNPLGTWGMCVRIADIPVGFTLLAAQAAGCPVPCNPTWSIADIAAVCGGDSFQCCQTVELQPEDCLQDADGTWRPANGEDIFAGDSPWAPNSHATHQDPNGTGCAAFSGTADISDPSYSDCLRHLTVANQRGYCMSVASCPPLEDPCAALNG